MRVRKAVIPVAGLGTRMLPATKVIPKELVPVVRKPAVQWVVESAVAAGIEEIIFVTAPGKSAIESHFAPDPALEAFLEARGKTDLLAAVRHAGAMARIVTAIQPEPLGLGHAVLMARTAVAGEPFAVILPDELVIADPPPLAQCLAMAEERGAPTIGLVRVPKADVSRYGIVAARGVPGRERCVVIEDAVEKPAADRAPSDLAIRGPYVLAGDIFDEIERVPRGAIGEIQLTDALAALARRREMLGCVLEGEFLDTGNPLGFVQANVALGLLDPDIGPALRDWLETRGTG